MSDDSNADTQISYARADSVGATFLVFAGCLSIASIVFASLYYWAVIRRSKTYHRTNLGAYLASLLIANLIQAAGSLLNYRWVQIGNVHVGGFCTTQGILKNAGNIGTALWSFTIAAHVFNLLFLRWRTTRVGMIITLMLGWGLVVLMVTVIPRIIETQGKRGPYFGISGLWCWITRQYPSERIFLEYFFEFLSAGTGFVLYSLVLLRVRGNLTKIDNRWRLRWVSSSQAWQLSFTRDIIDSAMLRVVKVMVWYPVVYSLAVVPIALARIISFTGHNSPLWAVILTDTIFNLTGFANALLFVVTRRILPDTTELPHFSTRRASVSEATSKFGVTPFAMPTTTTTYSRTSEYASGSTYPAEHGQYQHLQGPSYGQHAIPVLTSRVDGFGIEPQGEAFAMSEMTNMRHGAATAAVSHPYQSLNPPPYEEHERTLHKHEEQPEATAPSLPVALMNISHPYAPSFVESKAVPHASSSRSRKPPIL